MNTVYIVHEHLLDGDTELSTHVVGLFNNEESALICKVVGEYIDGAERTIEDWEIQSKYHSEYGHDVPYDQQQRLDESFEEWEERQQ